MRRPLLTRTEQSRLTWVIALLLGTVVSSAVAALLGSSAPAGRPAAVSFTLSAVDIVPPTPIDITFAKPQPPHRGPVPAPGVPTTPVRVASASARDHGVAESSSCSGAGWQQRRGEEALATLLHPVPAGVSVAFLPGRGALKGMTYYDSHHVDVYVGSCARESTALLRHVVAHEMGHAWDSLHMTDALRADYLAARGIAAGTPWFGCDKCQDFATPAGDFAETYAQWQRGSADSRSTMAAPASPAERADLGARFFS